MGNGLWRRGRNSTVYTETQPQGFSERLQLQQSQARLQMDHILQEPCHPRHQQIRFNTASEKLLASETPEAVPDAAAGRREQTQGRGCGARRFE